MTLTSYLPLTEKPTFSDEASHPPGIYMISGECYFSIDGGNLWYKFWKTTSVNMVPSWKNTIIVETYPTKRLIVGVEATATENSKVTALPPKPFLIEMKGTSKNFEDLLDYSALHDADLGTIITKLTNVNNTLNTIDAVLDNLVISQDQTGTYMKDVGENTEDAIPILEQIEINTR